MGDDVRVDVGVGVGVDAVGVADFVVDAVPLPNSFTARKAMEYDVPFVSPVMTMGVDVLAGERVTHVSPPSFEYSKLVIAEPPLFPGAVKGTVI